MRVLPTTLTLILQQVQIVGILAVAQSLIILTAGIDLSVGAMAVFCSVIMGQFSCPESKHSRHGWCPKLLGARNGAGSGARSGA